VLFRSHDNIENRLDNTPIIFPRSEGSIAASDGINTRFIKIIPPIQITAIRR